MGGLSISSSSAGGTVIGVLSFNGRTGVVVLLSSDVISALGFIPENVANKAIDFSVQNNVLYPTTLAVANLIASLPPGGVISFNTRTGAITLLDTDIEAALGYVPEQPLIFSTGLTRLINTITNDLSTGIAGGQSVVGGTVVGGVLTLKHYTGATSDQYFTLSSIGLAYGSGASNAGVSSAILLRPTLANIPNTVGLIVMYIRPTAYNTGAPRTSNLRGLTSEPTIGALNTQDWTAAASVVGCRSAPNILSGAAGVVNEVIAYELAITNSAAGVTINNVYGIYGGQVVGSVRATTIAFINFFATVAQMLATNNTYINVGNAVLTGNWGITQQASFPSYFNGNLQLGSTTATAGAEKLQVTGNGRITGNLIVNTIAARATAATIYLTTNAGTGAIESRTTAQVASDVLASGGVATIKQSVILAPGQTTTQTFLSFTAPSLGMYRINAWGNINTIVAGGFSIDIGFTDDLGNVRGINLGVGSTADFVQCSSLSIYAIGVIEVTATVISGTVNYSAGAVLEQLV